MTNRDKIRNLHSQGMGMQEIADQVGVSYSLVYHHIHNGAKKKRCATCRYRCAGGANGCDYILITGQRRGCPAEECTRYEKGKKARVGRLY